MAIFSIFQVVSVLTLCLYLIGLMNNLFSDKENACEMTYMYEYPQFVKVKVPENDLFPQYGLYAYSEGRFTERARKMRFDGVPVLFLPGNMGSHKQVRSLASVALRKALPPSKYGFHFDYFSIDFNEEMSGLFGGIFTRQVQFSSHCIQSILKLYELNNNKNKPSSVIIIGHSMGGIIGRALLSYPRNKNLISVILTLATPNEAPVIAVDHYFSDIYGQINKFWESKTSNSSDISPTTNHWKNKVFITIGGGERDHLVPSALTSSQHSDLTSLTTAIPGVWLSTDHLCIVWCKQLILVLNRFLFSIIDSTTKQLSSNSSHIIGMGKHYLMPGYSKNYSHYQTPVDFIPDAKWHEDSRRAYSFKNERTTKPWYYMIRLINLPNHEMATIQVMDLADSDWLFGCQAKYIHGQNRICMSGRHLSQFSQWGASRFGKRRTATLDLHMLHASYPHWTHIILRISPTYKPVQVHVDIHNKNSRQIQASLPAMYNFARRTIVKETELSAIRYNITLPGMDMLYQAYLLYVEPLESCQVKHHATAKLSIPWAEGYEYHQFFTETQKAPMRIRLLKGNPYAIKNYTQHVNILLTLDPQCRYSISIGVSVYDALGQLSRHYTSSLPAYLAAILLLVLRHWAANMHAKRHNGVSFHSALCGEYVKPYYLFIFTRFDAAFAMMPMLHKASTSMGIGVSSSQNFLLLPLFLYLVALGSAHILGGICWGFLVFSGQIAHRVLIRLVSFGKGGSGGRFWEWVAKEIRNVPGFGGFFLLIIGTASCGAAALATGAVFYFFLLTKMYEDYLEDFIYKTIAKVAKKFGKMTSKNRPNENETEPLIEEQSKDNKANLNEIPTENEKLPIESGKQNIDTESTSKETKKRNENEKRKNSSKSNIESTLRSLHFHFSMFFIWCLVTIINIPTLLTWAHNFKYSKVLEMDPSYYPSLVMSACAFSLWQVDAPKPDIKFYHIVDKLIYISAVITIMVAPISLYRLNYILPAVFTLITVHQTFSFKSVINNDTNIPIDESAQKILEEIKDTVDINSHKTDPKSENDSSDQSSSANIEKASINCENDDEIFEKLEELKEKMNFE